MTPCKEAAAQVIKLSSTVATHITLPSWMRLMFPSFSDGCRSALNAANAVGPAELTDSLVAFVLIDES